MALQATPLVLSGTGAGAAAEAASTEPQPFKWSAYDVLPSCCTVAATLSCVRCLLAGLLVITATGCGSADNAAQQPVPISSPTPALTNLATPTLSPTATPSSTATGTAIYVTASGLECYTTLSADIEYEPGMVDEGEFEGFSTFEEAVTDWWENGPGKYSSPNEPLTQSFMEGNKAGFRDKHGNTQLHLYGEQIINGLWAISRAELCDNPSTYIPH